jgi:hypothetical protein
LESSEVSERRTELLKQSVANALYSPRFEDGRAVATAGVGFEGRWDVLAGENAESTAPARILE